MKVTVSSAENDGVLIKDVPVGKGHLSDCGVVRLRLPKEQYILVDDTMETYNVNISSTPGRIVDVEIEVKVL
jgi:hypothetical protein